MTCEPKYTTDPQPMDGFKDAHHYNQLDLSDETSRTYVFGPGSAYRIDLPIIVAVKKTARGDTHRVVDAKGACHYIPAGWIAIHWTLKANTAIPLPNLSGEATAEIRQEDIDMAKAVLDAPPTYEEQREGTIDDLEDGIYKAIDDMENESAPVPTSREVEAEDDRALEELDQSLGDDGFPRGDHRAGFDKGPF